MGRDQTVTAYFNVPVTHTLTVQKAGTGTGTVTSSPAGIDCGSTCSHDFNQGTTVVLSANPDAGSTFGGWSGGGCSGTANCQIQMGSDKAGSAERRVGDAHTLTVQKAGTGTGTVTSSPAGIDCGWTGSPAFNQGTTVA